MTGRLATNHVTSRAIDPSPVGHNPDEDFPLSWMASDRLPGTQHSIAPAERQWSARAKLTCTRVDELCAPPTSHHFGARSTALFCRVGSRKATKRCERAGETRRSLPVANDS